MAQVTQSKLSRNDLLQYFISGAKPAARQRIGIEYENFGLVRPQHRPVPFFGSTGIQEILKDISLKYSWKKEYEDNNLIKLFQEEKTITLEPGGQVELSGIPYRRLADVEKELRDWIDQLLTVSEGRGIDWLALGIHPFSSVEEIPWVPKGRYAIMSRFMEKSGKLSHRMMKQTASVQVNLDYQNEKDALEKFRLLTALAPIFTAIFANSSIYRNEITPFVSYRAHVWQETDPGRCGLVRQVFNPDFSLEEYLDFILAIPLYFLVREGKWIRIGGMDFGQYLERGAEGTQATLEDWELHLSTVFTEVRLKQVLELRSADSHLPETAMAIAALAAGLLYSASAATAAWDLVRPLSWEERVQLYDDAPKYGLRTRIKNGTILTIARELMALSEKSLREGATGDPSEARYLDPVREILAKGKTRAEEGIEVFKKSPETWLEMNRLKRQKR